MDLLWIAVVSLLLGLVVCCFVYAECEGEDEPWLTADPDEDPFEDLP